MNVILKKDVYSEYGTKSHKKELDINNIKICEAKRGKGGYTRYVINFTHFPSNNETRIYYHMKKCYKADVELLRKVFDESGLFIHYVYGRIWKKDVWVRTKCKLDLVK